MLVLKLSTVKHEVVALCSGYNSTLFKEGIIGAMLGQELKIDFCIKYSHSFSHMIKYFILALPYKSYNVMSESFFYISKWTCTNERNFRPSSISKSENL